MSGPILTLVPRFPKAMPHPALVVVVLAWGLNFSVIKLAYHDVAPAAVGLFRYLLMWPMLVVWCWLVGQSVRYKPGTFWKTNFAGFVGSGAYMVLFLEGMRLAPPTHAAIALSTAPVLTTVLSVLLGQDRFSWKLAFGTLVAFLGVSLVVLSTGGSHTGDARGTLLVLGSAAFWAVSVVLYRPLLIGEKAITVLTKSFPGALVALVPYGAGPFMATDWGAVSPNGWAALAYLVTIAGVGAFAAYYRGLSDVGPVRSSLTQYFVPPVAALGAWFLMGEKPSAAVLVGIVVVSAGVALVSWKPFPEQIIVSE